jgi:hypothetical protein
MRQLVVLLGSFVLLTTGMPAAFAQAADLLEVGPIPRQDPVLVEYVGRLSKQFHDQQDVQGRLLLPDVLARWEHGCLNLCPRSGSTEAASKQAEALIANAFKKDPPPFRKQFNMVWKFGSLPEDNSAIARVSPELCVSGKLLNHGQNKGASSKFAASSTVVHQDPDFGPFMASMQRAISSKWHLVKAPRSVRVLTRFKVNSDGLIYDLSVVPYKSSHGPDMSPNQYTVKHDYIERRCEEAALQAVRDANPLPPLPAYAPNSIDLEFIFDHNVCVRDLGYYVADVPNSDVKFTTQVRDFRTLQDFSSDWVNTLISSRYR